MIRLSGAQHGGHRRHLQGDPVSYLATHAGPHGTVEIEISLDAEAAYLSDPVGFLADYYEVERDEYMAWHESEFHVQCSGTTAAGLRCRAIAVGGFSTPNPKAWVLQQGTCCYWHSEEGRMRREQLEQAKQGSRRFTTRDFSRLLGISYRGMLKCLKHEGFRQQLPDRTEGPYLGREDGRDDLLSYSRQYWFKPIVELWWAELSPELKARLRRQARELLDS